jgi:glycine/D-amino acid oxidase-like deaminating enzyme
VLPDSEAIADLGAEMVCLQKQSSPGHAVHVTLIDAVGIGAGGSGAAAGLLHPFTPKGKVCILK